MHLQEWHRDNFTISNDPARLDIALIHEFLSKSAYWALNRPLEVVERSIENSLNFGVYHTGEQQTEEQAGFCRVVTDYATFAWLCDVFILPKYRGCGLGKWLVECVVAHPDLQSLRRLILATLDAGELYRKYGDFIPLTNPERWMERSKK